MGHSEEDDFKALLYEMVIVRQDFQNPLASHSRHRYAVDEAVALSLRCSYKRKPARKDSRDCG